MPTADARIRKTPREFDHAIHHLRGLAIISIVLGHILRDNALLFTTEAERICVRNIINTIFYTGTHYFVFISGYLFYLLNKNINIVSFYKKKILYIILPYIVISSALLLLSCLIYLIKGNFIPYITFPHDFMELCEFLLNGSIQLQFWYIPFISIIFLFSLFITILKRNHLINLCMICAFLPLFFERRRIHFFSEHFILDIVNLLLYHGSVFFLGILYSMEKERINAIVNKYIIHILAMIVIFSFFIFFNYYHHMFSNTFSLYYVQKILILLSGTPGKAGGLFL